MRLLRTDFRLWVAIAFALWIAYLAWDYFTEPRSVIAKADYGYSIHGLHPMYIKDYWILQCLKVALVTAVLGWVGQAVAVRLGFRLGRSPNPALTADYDDKSTSDPAWLKFLRRHFGFKRTDND
jgi:hypothetical protein